MSKTERFSRQVEAELKNIIGSDSSESKYQLHKLMQKVVDRYSEQGKVHVLKMKAAADVIVDERQKLKAVYQEAQHLLDLISAACPNAMQEPSNALLVKQFTDLEKVLSVLDTTFGSGDADG